MKLMQLQATFAESLFYQHDEITQQIKETTQISPSQRLQVYRNSFIMGVTEALSMTYQHVSALVGDDFFNAVSREFILSNPPIDNNIITYGEGFSEYLNGLSQLNEMPYIAEMARFEWLLEQTSNIEMDDRHLDIEQLSQVTEASFQNLKFTTPAQINLFNSAQNISHLYQMLVDDAVVETDLNEQCYLALKKHADFRVELIILQEDEYSLLQQIKNGKNLGQITPNDLHQQLPKLLEKQLLNGFTVN